MLLVHIISWKFLYMNVPGHLVYLLIVWRSMRGLLRRTNTLRAQRRWEVWLQIRKSHVPDLFWNPPVNTLAGRSHLSVWEPPKVCGGSAPMLRLSEYTDSFPSRPGTSCFPLGVYLLFISWSDVCIVFKNLTWYFLEPCLISSDLFSVLQLLAQSLLRSAPDLVFTISSCFGIDYLLECKRFACNIYFLDFPYQ